MGRKHRATSAPVQEEGLEERGGEGREHSTRGLFTKKITLDLSPLGDLIKTLADTSQAGVCGWEHRLEPGS